MDNAINIMATGLYYRTQALNVTANNLANTQSNGFKRSELTAEEFDSYALFSIDDDFSEIGNANRGVTVTDTTTDFRQGTLYTTGRAYDFALNGGGYFVLADANGATSLTRNGSFTVDGGGYLTDNAGRYVLGQNGSIYVGGGTLTIGEKGAISVNGNRIDTLRINGTGNGVQSQLLADSSYAADADGVFTGKIVQGSLEGSNVNMTDEMAAMIEHSRAFQSCSQIVKMADSILKKTVTEIGRV